MNFVCKNDFPSLDFIKQNFDADQLRDNNFFYRRRSTPSQHRSCGGPERLLYDGYSVADVYIRHDCDVTIDVKDCAKVFVTLYDRANVKIRQGDMARVYVYKNGNSCGVETEGEVIVRERKSGA